MSTTRSLHWPSLGFAHPPLHRISDGRLLLYRCWGARSPGIGSREIGSGFFAVEKPASVLDAELRRNVADYDNGLRFVSTFRLAAGVGYWTGAVAHRADDLQRQATQVDIDKPSSRQFRRVTCEMLPQDVVVSTRDGHA